MHLQSRRQLLRVGVRLTEIATYVAAALFAMGASDPLHVLDHAYALSLPEGLAILAGFIAVRVRERQVGENRLLEGRMWATALSRSAIGTGALGLIAILLQGEALATRTFLVQFGLVYFGLELLAQSLLRGVLLHLRSTGRNLRHVLIVGSGPRAKRLVDELRRRPEYGYHLEGYVDDVHEQQVLDLERLGSLEQIEKVLDQRPVDEVFVALPIRSTYDAMQDVIFRCEERGVPAHVMTDLYSVAIARSSAHQVGTIPVLSMVSSGPMAGLPYAVKNVMDRILAATLLVLAAPVLLAISGLIALKMGRPIIYRQLRVGHLRRSFWLFKFRTMVNDADQRMADLEAHNEMDGPVFKMQHDPRVTPLGSVLRRYSLDELPQLFNVLRGDMSLVGPRPLPMRDVALFDAPWLNRRFAVRPGITCTWQVSGRNDVSFEEWIRMDLEYVDNWSLSRDLALLARTLPAVIGKSGAY